MRMATQVRCPKCGQTYAIAASLDGKSARCPECGHRFRVDLIGRYQVLDELGRGSFGVVYRVFDPKMAREAAVKVLHPEVAEGNGSAESLRRFRNEANLLAQIVHPNILPLYEADQHEGQFYLVTALIRGRQLDELIPAGGFPDPRRAVAFVVPLLEALHYVHSTYDICHRDVKPGNVMVGEGDSVFLMDFGLAAYSAQGAARKTTKGTALGTPAYMPPEQAQGDLANIGPWSDQYSAGVVLYHLLTGRVPFRKPFPALLNEIISAPPPPPSALRPDLGPEMDRIVLRALQKDRRARYRDCREFADRLRDWSSRFTVSGRAPAGSGGGVGLKTWVAIIGALLSAIVVGAIGYFAIWKGGFKPPPPPATQATTHKGEMGDWKGE
jgi:serine/threonine protein kinase